MAIFYANMTIVCFDHCGRAVLMNHYYKIDLLSIEENDKNLKGVDSKIATLDKNAPDFSDMLMMRENLDTLKTWCLTHHTETDNQRKQFYDFFENTIVGAFCRYRKSKTSTWSIKKNWLQVLGIAVLPILSALVMLLLNKANQTIIGDSVPVAFSLVIGFCLLQMYLEWAKNKNDKETWVRHSTCYERLNLALSQFALSKQEESDFQRLMDTTFSILEQNLDQFALNLSSRGVAKRN
jgi:hypothetical protein